jgi:hypothetical protein
MFGKGIQNSDYQCAYSPADHSPAFKSRRPFEKFISILWKGLGRDSSGCNAWNADVQIGRSSRTRLDGSGPFNLISPARWMAESTARPNNFQRLMPLMERFAL